MSVPDPGSFPWPVYPPEDTNASEFDWLDYLNQFPADALAYGSARRNLTRYNPLLFALLYFRHHLVSEATGNQVTMADFHLDSCRTALNWARPVTRPKQYRDAVIAPRETGKSTWWFLILLCWAAAHGHTKFTAAYSDTATQAQRHLDTFRKELENNALLRQDFRELRPARGLADNAVMIQTASGFTFTANGIEGGTLGLKVGQRRPDLLILDDIEPGESTYSLNLMGKRLSTVQDVIFPLNLHARVLIAGTVTMKGSIIDQLRESTLDGTEPEPWVAEENITVHWAKPIIEQADGEPRSLWPAKWPLEFLQSIAHTRSYAKNFANAPVGADGTYWTEASIARDGDPAGAVATYLSIDPAVTAKGTSDYTALAVVAYTPPAQRTSREGLQGTAVVRHASHIRLSPGPEFRGYVLRLLARYPEVRTVLVETNQGGDAWQAILHDLPVRLETVHQSVAKEVRAGQLLTDYEAGHVRHEGRLPDLETELLSFPKGAHDDLVDATGSAVARLREQEALRSKARPASRNRSGSYA